MEELYKAVQYVENGQIQKGLDLLENLQKKCSHETLFEIAELYTQWGLIDKAKEIIDELLLFYPSDGELIIFSAELLVESNQEEEAILLLVNIQAEDPSYLQALLLLADLYEGEGLEEVAEQKLLQAKQVAPAEPVVTFGLAEFYLNHGEFNKCLPYYKELLASSTQFNHIVLPLRLAEALSSMGQFEEALSYYEQGLEEKEDTDGLFGYGLTAFRAEQYKKAIHAFTRLKEMDPGYSTLYSYLAKSYKEEGALQEAMETCLEGLKMDDFNEELYRIAGTLSLQMSDLEAAETYFRKVIALNPSNTETVIDLASLLKRQERFDDIIELIDHVKEFGEQAPHFEWYLATANYEVELYIEALNHYENAYTYFNNDVVFLEEYGYFLVEEGQRKKAVQLFKKALALNPALTHLEETLISLEEF
jgi:tetratricopeptide (TPR) repeat protein